MSYFEKYLAVAPLSHALWRGSEALEIAKFSLEPPILDLGCGFGEFAGVFFEGMVEVGVDISQKDLELAIRKGKYDKVRLADARELPFAPSSFQTVISISTLEHIPEVEKVFREVYRILKPGGLFIFTVPTSELNDNLLVPQILTKLKLKRLAKLYVKSFHWVFKHKSIYSPQAWEDLVKTNGFIHKFCLSTIAKKTVWVFEFFLPAALPTQFFKHLLNRRLLISPKFRVKLLKRAFAPLLEIRDETKSNLLFVARKYR